MDEPIPFTNQGGGSVLDADWHVRSIGTGISVFLPFMLDALFQKIKDPISSFLDTHDQDHAHISRFPTNRCRSAGTFNRKQYENGARTM